MSSPLRTGCASVYPHGNLPQGPVVARTGIAWTSTTRPIMFCSLPVGDGRASMSSLCRQGFTQIWLYGCLQRGTVGSAQEHYIAWRATARRLLEACLPKQHILAAGWSTVLYVVILWPQVDSLDPGTCLMWIFGSLLSLFWLMYVFYGDLFDRVRGSAQTGRIMVDCQQLSSHCLLLVLSSVTQKSGFCNTLVHALVRMLCCALTCASGIHQFMPLSF